MTVVSWGCGARRRRSGPNIGTKRGHRKGKRRPAAHEKGRPGGRPSIPVVAGWTLKAARWRRAGQASLDLGFLELDMLARPRVVFPHRHLLGPRARVLLGDIEKARVGGHHHLYLDGRRLSPVPVPRNMDTSHTQSLGSGKSL